MSDDPKMRLAREMADQAREAAAVFERHAERWSDEPEDDDQLSKVYSDGVEDVLRYLTGDAPKTDALRRILEVGAGLRVPSPGDTVTFSLELDPDSESDYPTPRELLQYAVRSIQDNPGLRWTITGADGRLIADNVSLDG